MAKYYNKTRGPLSVHLSDGQVMSIRPKSWSQEVPRELEGSSDLMQKVRKKQLVRRNDLPIAPAPASASTPAKRKEEIASSPSVKVEEAKKGSTTSSKKSKSRSTKKFTKKASSGEESKASSRKE